MSESTNVGPLARADLRDSLHAQVQESVKQGARLVTGGEPVDGPGSFYRPTILAGVKPGMPAFDEELFGPVAAVIEAGDDNDAVRMANMSDYGLGACIWSSDTGSSWPRACQSGSQQPQGLGYHAQHSRPEDEGG